MAINVNKVYRVVLAILNKEQRGYLTPDQFNRIARQAQLDLFDKAFYDYNRAVRKQAAGDFREFADVAAKIREKIDIFHTSSIEANGDLGGSIVQPDGLYMLIGVYTTDRTIEFEEVMKNEIPYLLNSNLNQPTSAYPVYYTEGNNIKILPIDSYSNVRLDYVTAPSDPIWGYTGGGSGAYIYSEAASNDFEIHESDEVDLVSKILAYSGVVIKDPTVIQVAAQKEANDFNQDNI